MRHYVQDYSIDIFITSEFIVGEGSFCKGLSVVILYRYSEYYDFAAVSYELGGTIEISCSLAGEIMKITVQCCHVVRISACIGAACRIRNSEKHTAVYVSASVHMHGHNFNF